MIALSGVASETAAFALLAVLIAAFVSERYPPEVIALGGAAATLLLGLANVNEALGTLANPAPVAIAGMFVLSGALVRTGALDPVPLLLERLARHNRFLAVSAFLAATMVASAIVNNTPLVVVLIPVALRFAAVLGETRRMHLMPLSFAAILGGTCTLIGTSTNLLVDGVARAQGLKPFTMFEFLPIGVAVAIVGALYLMTFGRRMLADASGDQADAEATLGDTHEVRRDPRHKGHLHAVIATLTLIAVIGCAALRLQPLVNLVLFATVVLLFTRTLTIDEALHSIDARVLVLIIGMLTVGKGIEHSGAAAILVDGLATALHGLPPLMALAAIYILTSLLTEIISNGAVAVLVTPLAIGLAQALEIGRAHV